MKTMFVLSFYILLVMCLSLSAQEQQKNGKGEITESVLSIPSTVSYQGVLTDNNGVPVPDGSYSMTFTLWTDTVGGSKVWPSGGGETHNVQVTDGIFNVQLGAFNPLTNVAFDNQYWLQVIVSGTSLGRIPLSSSAYSFNTARIQGQSVSSNSPTPGQVLKWDGNQWIPENDGLTLPYFATHASGDLFFIVNDGTGKTARFYSNNGNADKCVYIESESSTAEALYVDGSNGGAAYFDGNVFITRSGPEVSLYVEHTGGTGGAGYFDGNVHVQGTFTSSDKQFLIDHPLDPQNMLLRHSCIESPDMMNIYNGNVTTDASGHAIIQLPDYFEALNKDFRYQLTVVGQFAQAIVSHEIQNNHFTIQTDKPDVKVSWQVTGIRKDAWAKKNPLIVEEQKSPDTRGFYLNPDAFGQPETRSMGWARNRELWNGFDQATANNEASKETSKEKLP